MKKKTCLSVVAGLLAAFLLLLPLSASAAGICSTSTVGATAVTVLAANTSSYPRKALTVQMTTTPTTTVTYAWCNIGGAAVANTGYQIQSGWLGSTSLAPTPATVWDLRPVQQSTNTFPQVPNGAVSCIASTSSQSITVCVY